MTYCSEVSILHLQSIWNYELTKRFGIFLVLVWNIEKRLDELSIRNLKRRSLAVQELKTSHVQSAYSGEKCAKFET